MVVLRDRDLFLSIMFMTGGADLLPSSSDPNPNMPAIPGLLGSIPIAKLISAIVGVCQNGRNIVLKLCTLLMESKQNHTINIIDKKIRLYFCAMFTCFYASSGIASTNATADRKYSPIPLQILTVSKF